jgi:hypothetical protein
MVAGFSTSHHFYVIDTSPCDGYIRFMKFCEDDRHDNQAEAAFKKNLIWGTCYYDEDGALHRVGGPAMIYSNGDKVWMYHGRCHRLDGPAVVMPSHQAYLWYLDNQLINCNSQEEFETFKVFK